MASHLCRRCQRTTLEWIMPNNDPRTHHRNETIHTPLFPDLFSPKYKTSAFLESIKCTRVHSQPFLLALRREKQRCSSNSKYHVSLFLYFLPEESDFGNKKYINMIHTHKKTSSKLKSFMDDRNGLLLGETKEENRMARISVFWLLSIISYRREEPHHVDT